MVNVVVLGREEHQLGMRVGNGVNVLSSLVALRFMISIGKSSHLFSRKYDVAKTFLDAVS